VRCREHVQQLEDDRARDVDGKASPALCPERVARRAVEQLHDQKRRAVLRYVLVHHDDGARVLDRVGGGVAFAQETRADVRVERYLRVEHLQREFGLVSVRRLVDDCHAPDSEDAVEAVLAAQSRAEARSCAREKFCVAVRHLALTSNGWTVAERPGSSNQADS
jgi:hypothetical protein